MSVTTNPEQPEHWQCNECDEHHPRHTFFSDARCSEACERKKQTRKLLNQIKYDHRLCTTCFAQLKEVHKPNKEVVIPPSLHEDEWQHAKDVFVGYQYRTPNADIGEISLDVDDATHRPIVEDGVATGTICRCGNTDHRHGDEHIRELIPDAALVAQFAATAELLHQEGEHDVDFCKESFEQALGTEDTLREALSEALIV